MSQIGAGRLAGSLVGDLNASVGNGMSAPVAWLMLVTPASLND
jgi:hypothetical protein